MDRMIFFGEGSLRKAIHEFVAYYQGERNHQGLGNRLIIPDESHAATSGAIRRPERLGGMLRHFVEFLRRAKEIWLIPDKADEKPEGTIFLIPVRLEECSVPPRLRDLQWVNLFEQSGYSRLRQALQARLIAKKALD